MKENKQRSKKRKRVVGISMDFMPCQKYCIELFCFVSSGCISLAQKTSEKQNHFLYLLPGNL